ncbi:hypothetical protein [Mycolicibacterium gilvum]|uniref:HNH endonuclease n=1 Tax=Mycolicibacterium gilvum TaxID=1804 RepID=A0A378SNR3_9MYCO|nr:hypothetical protein [Mycolicibacterium gilvum]MCV7057549.1 hypothetical protein [Mycolicibacterium gilvum]STZ43556.1 Uncharacterised protein [Mycolicibacterium gilvum]
MTRATDKANRRANRQWRAEILARDNFRCQIGKPGCATIGNHIHPRRHVAACQSCLNNPRAA